MTLNERHYGRERDILAAGILLPMCPEWTLEKWSGQQDYSALRRLAPSGPPAQGRRRSTRPDGRVSTRRWAPRPPGRRPQAAGAQLGLRPSCRTWLILCRRFDPNGRIEAELPRNNFFENGRGNRIRTCDPLVPNQMRYQTAPCPEPPPRPGPWGADPTTIRRARTQRRPARCVLRRCNRAGL